jgi:hypothetical protein
VQTDTGAWADTYAGARVHIQIQAQVHCDTRVGRGIPWAGPTHVCLLCRLRACVGRAETKTGWAMQAYRSCTPPCLAGTAPFSFCAQVRMGRTEEQRDKELVCMFLYVYVYVAVYRCRCLCVTDTGMCGLQDMW